jgi:hypothetical protein
MRSPALSTGRPLRGPTPDQGAQPGDQHDERERFGQVVVGAQPQALDPVTDAGRGGEQQHPGGQPGRGHRPAHLVTGAAGHVPVEHRHVVPVHGETLQGAVAVVDDVDGHGLPAQALGNRVGHQFLVLRHQHPHDVLLSRPGPVPGTLARRG